MGVKVMRENHVIKVAAVTAACCCLVAVAWCAVNSVQPEPYMVRTDMTPLICVYIFTVFLVTNGSIVVDILRFVRG